MLKKKLAAYADEISVAPGDTIRIMASADDGVSSYTASIVRLLSGDDQPGGPGYRDDVLDVPANGSHAARHQPTWPGAYGAVGHNKAFDKLESFSLQCLFWPTTPERPWKSIVSKFAESNEFGWGLFTNGDGHACFFVGDGNDHRTARAVAPEPLIARQWYLLTGSYDAETKTLKIVQRMINPVPTIQACSEATVPAPEMGNIHNREAAFMVGAYNNQTESGTWFPGGHVNGKIERPVLINRLLDDDESAALLTGALPKKLARDAVLAWDFSQEIGSDRLVDISGNKLDGEAVNLPIRAVRGHNWDATEFNWTKAPEQWGAMHFVEDAIYDCGWRPDFEVTIPESAKSGLYAAKLEADDSAPEFVPFVVRPPAGKTTASLCVLVPTASYLAYANLDEQIASAEYDYQFNRTPRLGPDDLHQQEHPEFGVSMYGLHADDTGPHYSSRLRPIANLSPQHNSLWQMSADMHLIAWLEHEGIAYDMVSDEDLDREGADLLARWPCVMTMSHPEYYSTRMLDGIQDYTRQGGRLMYMGGNGFYWRVAFRNDKPGVMEMRRAEDGSRSWIAEPGEYHMSFTGELGGLWWRGGRTPQSVVGVGFIAQGFDWSSPYRRQPGSHDPRAAWIFDGLGEDELIGDFGLLGDGAAGWELDCADPLRGTPPHALVLASSFDHSDTVLMVNEELGHMHPMIYGSLQPRVHADMVFFETDNGGAIFSTGSIAWVSALPCKNFDNNVAAITRNVIKRFCDKIPF
ncbi:MAG: N,N-dimethylformamidase beta subunit family domain-containing protein [Pseudomonadota bacterium]